MGDITLITADGTVGISAFYIAMAVALLLFALVFVSLCLANYKHKSNSAIWYKDQVYAFKVGYIKKKADELGIELIQPPKADLVAQLEDEVSDDLSTP